MGSPKKATLEDAWEVITELAKAQKETDRQLKETDRQVKETDRQVKEAQKETDRQLKETDRQVKEAQKETDRQLKETDRQLKETALQLKKTDRRFNSQWGKLVESLVEGDIARRFAERSIQVQGTTQRAKKLFQGKQYEFDILVHNGDEIIVVEVKTTLDVDKVKHFIEKLTHFKKAFPEYNTKKIYGAVAYIVADASSDKYAEHQKLFVIKATGNSSSIINSEDFKPRIF